MADFLESVGNELRAAHLRRRRRVARRIRATCLVGVTLVGIGTPAIALTQSWAPDLGRSDGRGDPVHADRAPVPREVRSAYAVMRRPQTARDRRVATPVLRRLDGQVTDGIQTRGIRALGRGWVLLPVSRFDTGRGRTPQLCLAGGGGMSCSPPASVATHGLTNGARSASSTGKVRFVGLVPDGVSRVSVSAAGRRVVVDARNNFFQATLTLPPQPAGSPIPAPEGSDGPTMIPPPPMPIFPSYTWLAADGRVIGPVP